MSTSIAERAGSTWAPAWATSVWATLAFGALASLLTWDPAFPPNSGLDASWVIGLHMAAGQGLDSGTEVVFSYGPLGFLDVPSPVGGATAALGALYRFLVPAALAASLLWSASRSFALPVAAALAFAATAITPVAIAPLSLTVVWCLVALQEDAPPWAARLVAVGGGAFAGMQILVKLNLGLAIVALVAITVVALGGSRLRSLATATGAFALTAAVLWLAAGQGIGNVDDFARASFEIVSGYSESMQVDGEHFGADLPLAAAIAVATIGFAAWVSRAAPGARRIGVVAVVAVLVYALGKQGFVRHDYGHVDLFIGGIVAPWLALRVDGRDRLWCGLAVAAIALAWIPMAHHVRSSIEPKLAVTQLADLLDPGRRDDLRERSRVRMQAAYGVPAPIIERIGDAPVDVRPWEIGLAWAYDLNWQPLPVIQDYQAYAPYLDRLNAEALATAGGPAYVLRHLAYGDGSTGIDGRFAAFDAPAATRAMLCRYRPVITAVFYELLERGRNRCGAERPLETVSAAYGEPVAVPSAARGEAVLASIGGADAHGLETLRSTAYRASIRHLELDGSRYRLTPRVAEDGLLLSVPPGADFPGSFALAPNAETITVTSDGGVATSGGPVEIEFEALPIEPLE